MRYNKPRETGMVMLNSNQEKKTVDGPRFPEQLSGFSAGTEGAAATDSASFKVPGWSALVMEYAEVVINTQQEQLHRRIAQTSILHSV